MDTLFLRQVWAGNEAREQFSVPRLLETLSKVVAAPSVDVVAAVIAAVRAHAGETAPSDDLTALALRLRGPGSNPG